MAAPRMHPQGRVTVTSQVKMEGRIAVYGYGAHPGAINPGDLVIVTVQELQENGKRSEVEMVLVIRGKFMTTFVSAARAAQNLYKQNEDWLTAPVSKPDTQEITQAMRRQLDSQATLNSFLESRGGGGVIT